MCGFFGPSAISGPLGGFHHFVTRESPSLSDDATVRVCMYDKVHGLHVTLRLIVAYLITLCVVIVVVELPSSRTRARLLFVVVVL